MKTAHLVFLFLTVLIVTSSCCNKAYEALRPPERIIKQEVAQPVSKLNVPILVTTKSIRTAALDEIGKKNPVLNETNTFPIQVFNPKIEPTMYVDRILVEKTCEVSRRINLPWWACGIWAPACFKMVVDHVACPFYQEVQRWVNEVIMQKITVDAPVGTKVNVLDINIEGNSNEIALHVKFEYSVDVDIAKSIVKIGVVSCGINEPMPIAELVMKAKVNFDNAGSIQFTEKDWKINYISNCNLTALAIPAQDIYSKFGLQGKFNKLIDDKVVNKVFPNEGFSFKQKIYDSWPKLAKPIKIEIDDSTNVHFEINTSKISAQELFLAGDSLHALFGIECKPRIIYDDRDPDFTLTPLPAITNERLPDGFSINLVGKVQLKQVNNAIAKTIRKNKGALEIDGVKLKKIEVYQSGDRLVAFVKMKKPVRACVYLWGVPRFNYDTNTVGFDDFDFTVETHTVLDPVVEFAKHFDVVRNFVREKVKYNYGTALKSQVDKFANFKYEFDKKLTITGSLGNITPLSMVISDNALNPIVNVSGSMLLGIK